MTLSGAYISLTFLGTVVLAGAVSAADGDGAAGRPKAAGPVVVELFSSQACSSCVDAAAYFRELAQQDNIVALGWHVDYWNHLSTKDGSWRDPYSKAAYTDRQRKYNINIRKRSSVYTPQIVVGGAAETVGSSREKVGDLIDAAVVSGVTIAVGNEDGAVIFDVGESLSGGNAYLVRFDPAVKTEIKGGENANMEFLDTNVVTAVERLGVVRRTGARLRAAPAEPDRGCALLVQEPDQGRIIAARYCP